MHTFNISTSDCIKLNAHSDSLHVLAGIVPSRVPCNPTHRVRDPLELAHVNLFQRLPGVQSDHGTSPSGFQHGWVFCISPELVTSVDALMHSDRSESIGMFAMIARMLDCYFPH